MVITDIKTSRGKWSREQVEDSGEQLLLYSHLAREIRPGKKIATRFLVLTKTKNLPRHFGDRHARDKKDRASQQCDAIGRNRVAFRVALPRDMLVFPTMWSFLLILCCPVSRYSEIVLVVRHIHGNRIDLLGVPCQQILQHGPGKLARGASARTYG